MSPLKPLPQRNAACNGGPTAFSSFSNCGLAPLELTLSRMQGQRNGKQEEEGGGGGAQGAAGQARQQREDRHRRPAQRGQVLHVQPALQAQRARRELPLLHHRPQRGQHPRARPEVQVALREVQARQRGRSRHHRQGHCRSGARSARGPGARKRVLVAHPRGRRHLPPRARVRERRSDPRRGVGRPRARSADHHARAHPQGPRAGRQHAGGPRARRCSRHRRQGEEVRVCTCFPWLGRCLSCFRGSSVV